MPRRTLPQSVALLGALALTLAAPAMATQAKSSKPASAAAPAAVTMPKTDRMPMAAFKALLAKGEVVIVDVRSMDAYATGHIPGALSIPEESITPAVAEKLKRMGKPIATYCA